jgi:DNA polymerase-1
MNFEHLLIESPDTLQNYLDQFVETEPVMGDTESTDLRLSATMLGFSFYQHNRAQSAFVALKTPFFQDRGIDIIVARKILNPWIKQHRFVFHNAKYDMGVFEQNGFAEPDLEGETTALIHLTDTQLLKNLETRVKEDFGYQKKKFSEIIGMKWDKIPWDRDTWKLFSLETLAEYAAEDVFWLHRIYEKYRGSTDKMGVSRIHDKIELPMTYVLKDMYRAGVPIDLPFLHKLDVECAKGLKDAEEKIFAEAGCRFNINSGKQCAEVLFDRLKYVSKFKTKGGARATDKKALKELAGAQGCTVAEYILEHSMLSTLYSSFISAIPRMTDEDGRLRCQFNSVGTETGRFSSSKPNLQNQPNNKKYPVRQGFVASKGCKFVVLDYSQIELRVTAHLSHDEKLMEAFKAGRDIHQEVADQVGVTRSQAKTLNFAMLYGLGAISLAESLKISEREAGQMLEDYASTYDGVASWKTHVEKKAKRDGFVKNMFGRIRMLPNVNSQRKGEYFAALRQAVNTTVQGTAADMMKIAMIKIHKYIKENQLPAQILLTVHDELVIEVKNSYATQVFAAAKHLMENVTEMRVPIIAEGKICDNWAQNKDDDYKGYPVDQPIPDEDDCYFDRLLDYLYPHHQTPTLLNATNQSIINTGASRVRTGEPLFSLLDLMQFNNFN